MSETAYFVVFHVETRRIPEMDSVQPPLWRLGTMGSMLCGYILASEKVDSPEAAARTFLEFVGEQHLVDGKIDVTKASVGIIADSVTVSL